MSKNKKIKDDGKSIQTKLPMFYNLNPHEKEKSKQEDKIKSILQKLDRKNSHHMKTEEKVIKEKNQKEKKESPKHSDTDKFSSISARSNSPIAIVQKKQPPKHLNVQFYLNKIQSLPFG